MDFFYQQVYLIYDVSEKLCLFV